MSTANSPHFSQSWFEYASFSVVNLLFSPPQAILLLYATVQALARSYRSVLMMIVQVVIAAVMLKLMLNLMKDHKADSCEALPYLGHLR